MKSITIEVDGRAVVVNMSQGTRQTLVLVHGAGGNHRFWDELVPHLRDYSLIIPSLPGRCGTEGPALDSVDAMAHWLARVLATLNIQQPILVGHSLGGAIAMTCSILRDALQGPAPHALVLLTTGARLRVHPAILTFIERAAKQGRVPDFGWMSWRPDTPRDLIERFEQTQTLTPPASALADWTTVNQFDRMDAITSISQPTLVMGGTEDSLTPAKYAQYLAEHIPQAKLVLLEGGGHMLPVERSSETAEHIRTFLDTLT